MIKEVICKNIFPTFVFDCIIKNKKSMNDALIEAIYLERARDERGIERSNCAKLGGWHSKTTLHKDPDFALLAFSVRDVAKHISQELGYAPTVNLDIEMMWAIINGPGAFNRAHIHPGSLWSGVYYVKADEGSGKIEFTDPRTANLMRQPTYAKRPADCDPAKSFVPEPGRMLVFPSWLYHSVHPNLTDGDRVIVSFNLSLL